MRRKRHVESSARMSAHLWPPSLGAYVRVRERLGLGHRRLYVMAKHVRYACVVGCGLAAAALCLTAKPGSAESYARFCTNFPVNSRGVSSLVRQAQAALPTDGALADAVQKALHLSAPPQIVGRELQGFRGKPKDAEIVLLSDLNPVTPHWWETTLKADGSIDVIEPADSKFVTGVVGFVRSMARYGVFNQLVRNDQPSGRDACLPTLFWFPAVLSQLQNAIREGQPQDPVLSAAVQRAWLDLPANRSGTAVNIDLTRETVNLVGANPPVTIVYHDIGLPGDGVGELDVVRIGAQPHAYAMVSPGISTLDGAPLCVVGDERCWHYYTWP